MFYLMKAYSFNNNVTYLERSMKQPYFQLLNAILRPAGLDPFLELILKNHSFRICISDMLTL